MAPLDWATASEVQGTLNGNDMTSQTEMVHCRWHSYQRKERHAGWKVLLPVSTQAPILIICLGWRDIASLARTWKRLIVYKCSEQDCAQAAKHAHSFGYKCEIEAVQNIVGLRRKCGASVVGEAYKNAYDLDLISNLLELGGLVLWCGTRGGVPAGSELFRRGYYQIRRYALLPPTNSKIIVPINSRSLTRSGLRLYMPSKRGNRMAIHIGDWLARVGCQHLLGRREIVIARKPGLLPGGAYLTDWLASWIRDTIAEIAVHIGWNMLTIQILDKDGKICGIAKFADTLPGRRAVERETCAFARLEGVMEVRQSVPRILGAGEWDNYIV